MAAALGPGDSSERQGFDLRASLKEFLAAEAREVPQMAGHEQLDSFRIGFAGPGIALSAARLLRLRPRNERFTGPEARGNDAI